MFNIRYNILVIIQITIGILNAVLLVNLFGASTQSDSYLLSCSILAVLQLIFLLPISQFLPFYNDLKVKSIKKSHDFYNFLLFFSILYGILLCLIFYYSLDLLIKFFVMNIDNERLIILKKLLSVSMFGLAFYSVTGINERLLNAEMRFSVPYILNIIPNASVVVSQIILIIIHSRNIFILAYAQAIAMFLCAVIGTIYISTTLIRYKFIFRYDNIVPFVKNSILMKFGDSIYHIFIPTILNNFLVTMPKGFVSYFYYARKVIDIVNNFSIGPSVRVLQSKISKSFSKCNVCEIEKYTKDFILYSSLIFISILFFAYFLQVPILEFISNKNLTMFELKQIQKIFLSLIPWYIFMLVEIPFVIVNTTSKKSYILILVNSSFVFIFALSLILLEDYIKIYAISISAMLAQFLNFIFHKKFAIRILAQLKNKKDDKQNGKETINICCNDNL